MVRWRTRHTCVVRSPGQSLDLRKTTFPRFCSVARGHTPRSPFTNLHCSKAVKMTRAAQTISFALLVSSVRAPALLLAELFTNGFPRHTFFSRYRCSQKTRRFLPSYQQRSRTRSFPPCRSGRSSRWAHTCLADWDSVSLHSTILTMPTSSCRRR